MRRSLIVLIALAAPALHGTTVRGRCGAALHLTAEMEAGLQSGQLG